MKTTHLFFLIVTFISSQLYSMEEGKVTIEQCQFESLNYINGREYSDETISQECKELIFNLSSANAYRDYSDKGVIVFGHKNLIFAFLDQKTKFNSNIKAMPKLPAEIEIGGSGMNVSEIHSLDVDFKNGNIIALVTEKESGEKAIHTYFIWMSGNQAPIKKFKHNHLNNVTNIRVDSKNEKIYALNSNDATAYEFTTDMDLLNTYDPKFKVAINDELGKENSDIVTLTDLAFSKDGNEIYILDSSDNRIVTINSKGEKGRSPTAINDIHKSIKLSNLLIDENTGNLKARTPQGKFVNIKTSEFIERKPTSKNTTEDIQE